MTRERPTVPAELVDPRADRASADVVDASEPPVVARLVIEIRSDGSRTIARGALEDALQGETVSVRAEGTTPLMLAASLMRSLVRAPLLGRVLGRGLLGGKRRG